MREPKLRSFSEPRAACSGRSILFLFINIILKVVLMGLRGSNGRVWSRYDIGGSLPVVMSAVMRGSRREPVDAVRSESEADEA